MLEAVSTTRLPAYERETHVVEGHVWVTSGSRICPVPSLADQRDDETYEAYVFRHARNHRLGDFDELEDAERNLGVWCGFFYARHIQGNESLGTRSSAGCQTRGCEKTTKECATDHKIVAHYEPCWEDAEYLFNDEFAPEDLEMNLPDWSERTFTLLPADQRNAQPVYKRFKKYVKTRGTQKTSWGKAKVTFELLHAYFIVRNPYFRILTMSKASTAAREQYFKPLKQLWSRNTNIKRLYGVWETRCQRCKRVFQTKERPTLCPDENCLDILKFKRRRHILKPQEEPQRIGIITRGSFGRDVLTARWIVHDEQSSAMTTVTLMCLGVDSASVGNRWDLVLFDDPHDRKNIKTPLLRQNVKDMHAELRKQLDARGRLVWLCTPWHIDDASAEIDEKYADEFHIMYRPAVWGMATATPVYYWEYDALACPVWNVERVKKEERQLDFSSQVLLQPRDPKSSIYEHSDFQMIDPENCPPEVRFGLGRAITDEEHEILRREGAEQYAYNFVDSAGKAEQSTYGCDTGHVGWRVARKGLFITYISSGQWNVSEELNDIWAGNIRNRPSAIVFELSAAHQKYVRPAFDEFVTRKRLELRRPVSLSMYWEPVSTEEGQESRIEAMHPFIKGKKVFILSDAGTPEQIEKFKSQFVHYRGGGKRDLADAASRILMFLTPEDEEFEPTLPEHDADTLCGVIVNRKRGTICGVAFEDHDESIPHAFEPVIHGESVGDTIASMPFNLILDRVRQQEISGDEWGDRW